METPVLGGSEAVPVDCLAGASVVVEPMRGEPFDGRQYYISNWRDAPLIYLAKKAREGDADAAAALSAFQITVKDVDGKLYWPLPINEMNALKRGSEWFIICQSGDEYGPYDSREAAQEFWNTLPTMD